MPRYVIAIFPRLPEDSWVEQLRRRFDPLAGKVPAHLTLAHPFECAMTTTDLRSHIAQMTAGAPGFELELQGVTGHLGEYLFLNVRRGNDEVIASREKLYRERLAAVRDPASTFLPHVTVGRLPSRHLFLDALVEAQEHRGAITTRVNEVTAYRIEADGHREIVAEVRLAG